MIQKNAGKMKDRTDCSIRPYGHFFQVEALLQVFRMDANTSDDVFASILRMQTLTKKPKIVIKAIQLALALKPLAAAHRLNSLYCKWVTLFISNSKSAVNKNV
ncbi:hypothetical protein [Sporolactobacillus spathodeae]|uniref:Uncharacterized protein n=1 Tax=Sporolactobacillus spathodeae TaxID=1465502 RepID=A0ABS2Q574_9BACL|nr:hypothetical protein [Sporolactobacillus spathodeae]MBM7656878.1 hypothetical protein [Sporolactobacillus spathodeae]